MNPPFPHLKNKKPNRYWVNLNQMDPNNQNTAQSPIRDETSNYRSSDAISSPVSDSTHESTFCSMSPTQSPPIQVMERPEDFSNRCSSSTEWSSLSNESLFSIHITNSYTHDQAHLLATDAFQSGDLMSFGEHSGHMSGDSDVDSLRVETPTKLDVPMSTLDEPQKVVRWKTQVERLADEGGPSQGHQFESSPLTNHKSNESTAKQKLQMGSISTLCCRKKFCWSLCDCGSCKLPKWSCWNGCWTSMSCSKCKPKKVFSSHSMEANAPIPTSAAPKKGDVKFPKLALKTGCCFKPCFSCFRSCSWSCHCC